MSANWEMQIGCSEDDQIVLYDFEKGTQIQTVSLKMYGWRWSIPPTPTIRPFTAGRHDPVPEAAPQQVFAVLSGPHGEDHFVEHFTGGSYVPVRVVGQNVEAVGFEVSKLSDLQIMHQNRRPVAAYDPERLIFEAGVEDS